jgi:hypothetical protein
MASGILWPCLTFCPMRKCRCNYTKPLANCRGRHGSRSLYTNPTRQKGPPHRGTSFPGASSYQPDAPARDLPSKITSLPLCPSHSLFERKVADFLTTRAVPRPCSIFNK